MPLICENVAAWAIDQGNGPGDIAQNLIFWFDPNSNDKDQHHQKSCGCFAHGDCVGSGKSSGKKKDDKVTDIASSTLDFGTIPPAVTQILKDGTLDYLILFIFMGTLPLWNISVQVKVRLNLACVTPYTTPILVYCSTKPPRS